MIYLTSLIKVYIAKTRSDIVMFCSQYEYLICGRIKTAPCDSKQLEGVHRTLTPLDVVREVGAWIWIRDREQGYYNKRSSNLTRKNTA